MTMEKKRNGSVSIRNKLQGIFDTPPNPMGKYIERLEERNEQLSKRSGERNNLSLKVKCNGMVEQKNVFLKVRQLVVESARFTNNERLEYKHHETIVQDQKKSKGIVGWLSIGRYCRKYVESNGRGLMQFWNHCGMVFPDVFIWRSTCECNNMNALFDPNNHARWKHKRRWDYLGCVWWQVSVLMDIGQGLDEKVNARAKRT